MSINIFDFTGTAKKENKRELGNLKEFLKNKFNNKYSFGNDNLSRLGIYKEMGWAYDFRPNLKKFLVKQYGTWTEIYAPNKTLARKQFIGKIDAIKEL